MELIKCHTVMQLLTQLEERFGKKSFHIEDYWDGDLCAIGLADTSGRYLLYINTFDKPNDTFYAELEDKAQKDSIGKATMVFESMTNHKLEEVFEQYFVNIKS